jgi:hypothetical protein
MKEFNFNIIEKEVDHKLPYKSVRWFRIEYKELLLSIYYDGNDELGFVGAPYFEAYDLSDFKDYSSNFEDTERFLATKKGIKNLLDFLVNEFKIHDLDLQNKPELFI